MAQRRKLRVAPSPTAGIIVELDYALTASAPHAGPGYISGNLDSFRISTSNVTLGGWVVDSQLDGGGVGPVTVVILVDGKPVLSTLANEPRPDIVRVPSPCNKFAHLYSYVIFWTGFTIRFECTARMD